MKSFKTRVELAIQALLNASKVGTVLEPVPVVLGDSEQERPDCCVVVYADTDRPMDGCPPRLKNRETVVKVVMYHNARDYTAEVHGERHRAAVEILENNSSVLAAIAAQDIRPYEAELDSEDDVSTKDDFANFVAYRVRGVDNPPTP